MSDCSRMNVSRPKRGESEDDLLRQQDEFLKKKDGSTSVKLVNKRKGSDGGSSVDPTEITSDSVKRNRSKYSITKTKENSTASGIGIPSVLGEIMEKNVDENIPLSVPKLIPQGGFPQAFYRDKSLKGRGRSIFSQQCEKKDKTSKEEPFKMTKLSDSKEILGDQSFILSGTEADAIHEENLIRISRMSHDEILEEQQKLKAALDPKTLHFIRSRRNPTSSMPSLNSDREHITQVHKEKTEQTQMEVDDADNEETALSEQQPSQIVNIEDKIQANVSLYKPTVDIDMLQEVPVISEAANKWLHMDVVEVEKLKWISEIPEPPPLPPDKAYAARFDFQGLLLPYFDEKLDVNKGLHHHGEEPARPGYTLQELFQLTRSAVLQQRVLSITTISNILEKTKSGYYDKCMHEPLLKVMLDSDLLLLLRFSLDDNTESIVSASLLALKNLLWNFPDEVCLDRFLGCNQSIKQPIMEVKIEVKPEKKEELKDEEKEMKDYEIARIDTVKGALRTDIILRLRYILETLKPGPKAVIAALEVLTRIARHSHESALAISSCPRLISVIINNFLPRDWRPLVSETKPQDMTSIYGVPLVQAIKFIRILACASHNVASDMSTLHQIPDILISYISIDPRECGLPESEVLRLSLESLYLWQTLLSYNLATQSFMDMYPVFMRLLQFHLNCTSASDETSTFGHEHGAALFSLINVAITIARDQRVAPDANKFVKLPIDHFSSYVNPVEMCAEKWLTQLKQAEKLTFSALKLLASNFSCLATMYSCCQYMMSDMVSQLERIEYVVGNKVASFLQSSNYIFLTKEIKQTSCLLYEGQTGSERDPEALPSLGALLWGGEKVTPVLQPSSPYPFLGSLASLLKAAYGVHKGLNMQIYKMFVNDHVVSYLNKLITKKLNLVDHWFTRIEIFFLFDLVVLSHKKGDETAMLFHSLGVRLASLIPRQEKLLLKQLLKIVVFSPHYFRDVTIVSHGIKNVKISHSKTVSDKCQLLQDCIKNLDNIYSCYETAFGLGSTAQKSQDIMCLTEDVDKALPHDWMYLPILKLNEIGSSGKPASNQLTTTATACLEWILMLEYLCPSAMASINVTARYCNLSKVFLAASDLFLDSRIGILFEAVLQEILQHNSEIDFKSDIPGVSSFYDLYNDLLEQFSAVSYGNLVFGQFIIIPLQQRHGSSLKRLLWSEQIAVLRVLGVPVEKLMIPLEELLQPCEMDPSLLNIYFQSLVTGVIREKWSPVMYKVAVHHVATYIRQYDDILAQQLKEKILTLQNKEIQSVLLKYEMPAAK